LPNGALDGEMLMFGAMPVPVSATVCGLPVTLSVKVKLADLAPPVVGEKVTGTVVLLPAVTVIGSVAEVKVNWLASVPDLAMLVITRSAVPLFVITRFVGLLEVPAN